MISAPGWGWPNAWSAWRTSHQRAASQIDTAWFLGSAATIRRATGAPPRPTEERDLQKTVTAVRAHLDETPLRPPGYQAKPCRKRKRSPWPLRFFSIQLTRWRISQRRASMCWVVPRDLWLDNEVICKNRATGSLVTVVTARDPDCPVPTVYPRRSA